MSTNVERNDSDVVGASLSSVDTFDDVDESEEDSEAHLSTISRATTSTSLVDRREACIIVSIIKGVNFKHAIDFLKSETDVINITFTANEIHFSTMNAEHNVCIFKLTTDDLLYYRFECYTEDCDELMDEITIGFNAKQFYNCMKSINTNNGVVFYYDDRHRRMAFSTDLGDHIGKYMSYASQSSSDRIHLNVDIVYKRDPIRISVDELGISFKNCIDLKCVKMMIRSIHNTLIIAGYDSNNKELHHSRMASGQFDENQGYEDVENLMRLLSNSSSFKLQDTNSCTTMYIHKRMIRSLSKIKKIAAPGCVLKMYFDKDHPLKISFKVGTFGAMDVYLMREDN